MRKIVDNSKFVFFPALTQVNHKYRHKSMFFFEFGNVDPNTRWRLKQQWRIPSQNTCKPNAVVYCQNSHSVRHSACDNHSSFLKLHQSIENDQGTETRCRFGRRRCLKKAKVWQKFCTEAEIRCQGWREKAVHKIRWVCHPHRSHLSIFSIGNRSVYCF